MSPINTLAAPDTIGAAFGILGTIMLAINGKRAGWGFVAYLVSNAAWLTYAVQTEQAPLLIQTTIFAATSLLGVWVWLVKPKASNAFPQGAMQPIPPIAFTMSNTELCEAIQCTLTTIKRRRGDQQPIYGIDTPDPLEDHLATLIEVQRARATFCTINLPTNSPEVANP